MNINLTHMAVSKRWRLAAALMLTLICGCEALRPAVSSPPNYYSLANLPATAARNRGVTAPSAPRAAAAAPTLIVSSPLAAAGFDSRRIMYMRHPGQLEYFAHNEWIDTPARMLEPLMVNAVEGSAAFRAVVPTPSHASAELRLDTEILRLQQEFRDTPSRVRFALRAYLVESATRKVVAAREFEAVAAAPSDDPLGGVIAAQQAVGSVLAELAVFCAQNAGSVGARDAGGTPPR